MTPELRPGLESIKPHMVAADDKALARTRINIASNESAFGPADLAIAAATEAIQRMERYADGAEAALTERVAHHHALSPDGVVCGNGSDDLLARLARAFLRPGDELICSINGYQKIPNYAYANDAVPVRANDSDFTTNVDEVLSCVSSKTRIVMIANPDNPSGTWVSGSEVRRLQQNLPSSVLLILDSAYLEYVDDDEFGDPASLVEENENVVMTRTFSKIYGLAGLRLGWMYAPKRITDAIRKIGMTFPISNVAFECAKAAMADREYTKSVFERNLKGRQTFAATLERLGARVFPSQTNFLLAKFPPELVVASDLHRELLAQGIFTRRLASDAFSDCIRFTIGTPSQMKEVSHVLQDLINGPATAQEARTS